MGSRLALMVATAAFGCAIALAAPASAQVVIDGNTYGLEPQAGTERAAPTEGTEPEAAPQDAPPPPGCPYRDRKLDLIV